MQDWILYFNEENYDFPGGFKNALSIQLKQELEATLACPGLLEKYFFNLFIGRIDMELQERDGYTFASIEIVSPDSFSRPITIAWNKDSEGTPNFFFCDDLPVADLLVYIRPNDKNKNNASFETYINYSSFPDLSAKFEITENLEDGEIKQIIDLLSSDTIYVSEGIKNCFLLDFQSNDYSNPEIEKYLHGFVDKLNNLEFKSKIKSLRIE